MQYKPIKPCRAELGLARQDEVGWAELTQVSFQYECILSWPNCASVINHLLQTLLVATIVSYIPQSVSLYYSLLCLYTTFPLQWCPLVDSSYFVLRLDRQFPAKIPPVKTLGLHYCVVKFVALLSVDSTLASFL